jgi:hypothetical protein
MKMSLALTYPMIADCYEDCVTDFGVMGELEMIVCRRRLEDSISWVEISK